MITSSPKSGSNTVIPKSDRLILVVAEKPADVLLLMGFTPTLFKVTFNETGLDAPRNVNTPFIIVESLPVNFIALLIKVAVG